MTNQTHLQRAADLLAQSAGPFDEACRIVREAAQTQGWQPIETAPHDGNPPIFIAQFRDNGELAAMDWDATLEREQESWEMPGVYHVWKGWNGTVEEPTHWMPMPPTPCTVPADAPEPSLAELRQRGLDEAAARNSIAPATSWLPCPDWVMWQATDEDGEVWGFQCEPFIPIRNWNGRRVWLGGIAPPADFRTTLIQRPSIPTPSPTATDDEAVRAQKETGLTELLSDLFKLLYDVAGDYNHAWPQESYDTKGYRTQMHDRIIEQAKRVRDHAIARERARGTR